MEFVLDLLVFGLDMVLGNIWLRFCTTCQDHVVSKLVVSNLPERLLASSFWGDEYTSEEEVEEDDIVKSHSRCFLKSRTRYVPQCRAISQICLDKTTGSAAGRGELT